MFATLWVLLIPFVPVLATTNGIVGLKFSSNNAENVSLTVQPGFEPTAGFTLCFRAYFINLQTSIVVVDDRGLAIFFKDYAHSKAYIDFGGHRYSTVWPYNVLDLNPFIWYSFCLAVDTGSQVIRFAINTFVALREKLEPMEQENFQLGKELLLGNSEASPFVGKLSDLNVWNEPLTDEQLKKFATCNVEEILDGQRRMPVRWTTASQNIQSATVKVFPIGYDQLCQEDVQPKLELFYNKLSPTESRRLCGNLNGKLPLPTTDQDLELMKAAMAQINYIWLPITWSSALNTWISDDGQEVAYLPWDEGQPNGDGTQSCVVFSGSGYNDNACSSVKAHLCEVKKYPPWRLRGPCSNEKRLDTRFAFHKDDNNLFEFRGYSGLSSIVGKPDSDSWEMVILEDGGKLKTVGTRKPFGQFPLGLTYWQINEGFCGSVGKKETLPLKLTKVKEQNK